MVRKLIFAGLCGWLLASPAVAQVPADTLPADTIPRESNVPRAAFIKALVVPGWGHFSIGAEKRGAVFVALQGSSWYMLIKTLRKVDRAQEAERQRVGIARDTLDAQIARDTALARQIEANPLLYDQRIARDTAVARVRGLVESRKQQRQDWITYTLFFTFAGAVDAYVAAHLQNFPGEITAVPGGDGGMSLQLSMPLGTRRRR